ncbi:MAG: hypothetical protein JNL60_10720 [Bacteroidia bacterium]|nr:hypothetical protein [Bacteroidia bacterium]
MKFLSLSFSGILVVLLMSCKAQQPKSQTATEPQPTSDPTVYKGVTDANCAMEVSFGSYGSGIDSKAYEKVIAAIESNKLASTSKNIGREGETRICLPLTELKGEKKTQFIDQLKKIAKEGQLVSVSIR